MSGTIQSIGCGLKAAASLSAGILCLIFSGCAAPPPKVTAQLAALAPRGTSADALHRGRAIYTGICVACHGTDSPDAFNAERWREIVRNMAGRSHLKRQQEEDLITYLLAARESVLLEKAEKASPRPPGS